MKLYQHHVNASSVEQTSLRLCYYTLEPLEQLTEDRELLIALHGFPESGALLLEQLRKEKKENHKKKETLSTKEPTQRSNYFIAAPDLRGYDGSDKPEGVEHYRIEWFVKDLLTLIEHLQHLQHLRLKPKTTTQTTQTTHSPQPQPQTSANPITLLGHDWGGMIAWHAALFAPHIIKQLITLNAPHPARWIEALLQHPKQQQASAYLQTLQQPMEQALAAVTANDFRLLVDALPTLTESELTRYRSRWSSPNALRSMLSAYHATTITAPFHEQRLKATLAKYQTLPPLTCPVTTYWGTADPYFIADCFLKDQRVLNETVIAINHGGHWLHHEKQFY